MWQTSEKYSQTSEKKVTKSDKLVKKKVTKSDKLVKNSPKVV